VFRLLDVEKLDAEVRFLLRQKRPTTFPIDQEQSSTFVEILRRRPFGAAIVERVRPPVHEQQTAAELDRLAVFSAETLAKV
jgi:hypothetical protein